jgi:type II secretory ATPase GspE/PulE/Tfp pilus assembly ATPase PilB-like protein
MLDPILQILVQNGYIDDDTAADLQELSKTEAKPVRQLVIDQEILTEDDLLGAMAAYQDTEAIDLGSMTIETEVTEAIPASTARMYNVFPVAADDSSVTLATFDLVDPRISDEMLFTLSKEVRFVFAREKDVMDRISQYYGDASDSVADMMLANEGKTGAGILFGELGADAAALRTFLRCAVALVHIPADGAYPLCHNEPPCVLFYSNTLSKKARKDNSDF